jgi:hypothetical protein
MPLLHSPRAARDAGIVYLPANRKFEGLLLNRPVRQNLSLGNLRQVSRGGLIGRRKESDVTDELAKTYDVRAPSLDSDVASLSGGNQQKVLFANRLYMAPQILVAHEPTRASWGEFLAPMALSMAKGVKPPDQAFPPQAVVTKDNVDSIFNTDGSVKLFPALPAASQYLLKQGIPMTNVAGATN